MGERRWVAFTAWEWVARLAGCCRADNGPARVPTEVAIAAIQQTAPLVTVAQRSHLLLEEEGADRLGVECLGASRGDIERAAALVAHADGEVMVLAIDLDGGNGHTLLHALG